MPWHWGGGGSQRRARRRRRLHACRRERNACVRQGPPFVKQIETPHSSILRADSMLQLVDCCSVPVLERISLFWRVMCNGSASDDSLGRFPSCVAASCGSSASDDFDTSPNFPSWLYLWLSSISRGLWRWHAHTQAEAEAPAPAQAQAHTVAPEADLSSISRRTAFPGQRTRVESERARERGSERANEVDAASPNHPATRALLPAHARSPPFAAHPSPP